MIKKHWKIAVAAAFLTAAGFCYGFMRTEPEERMMKLSAPGEASGTAAESVQPFSDGQVSDGSAAGSGVLPGAESELETSSGGAAAGQAESSGGPVPTSETLCFVHICGEVEAPGVYELLEGSRLFQAVEAAGGMTDQAAADSVNLAAPVRDGMQVRIPSLEEVKTLSKEELQALSGASSEAGTGKEPGVGKNPETGKAPVNLNTAGAEELMSLNGIGKARAEEIIRYRTEHGSFQSIEDIKDIPGIKDALFQKIKDSITV